MTSSFLDIPELYQFESLHDRAIMLTEAQIQQAHQDSQASSREQAWQIYCDRLAHFGLINWLAENNLVTQDSEELKEELKEEFSEELKVRNFVLRSQFISASEDEFVTITSNKRELNTPAHFYVLTTVAEEQGQVWISGFLSQDQLNKQLDKQLNKQLQSLSLQSLSSLAIKQDVEPIEIPLSAFNSKIESLLLTLRLTDAPSLSMPLCNSSPYNFNNQVINLRYWISQQWNDTLDRIVDGWEPLIMNSLSPASSLRGRGSSDLFQQVTNRIQSGSTVPNHDLPQILQSLARKGIRLANNIQGMSRILNIAPIPLRLYIMPGDVTEQGEWELLVVLESATDEPMPSGLMLRIRDDEKILLEQKFDPQVTSDRSLFAEVVSALDESVLVEIVLPNGRVHSLPKFVFQNG